MLPSYSLTLSDLQAKIILSPLASGDRFLSTWNVSKHAGGPRLPPSYETILRGNSGNTRHILVQRPRGGSRFGRERHPRLWFSRFARPNSAPNKDAGRQRP